MIRLVILARVHLNELFTVARSPVCVGRALLFLAAVELLTMPITQHLWAWDRFLRGGQDFELTFLVIISCLCLILLRVEQSRRSLGLLVLMRALLWDSRERAASRLHPSNAPEGQLCRIPRSFPATPLVPLLI